LWLEVHTFLAILLLGVVTAHALASLLGPVWLYGVSPVLLAVEVWSTRKYYVDWRFHRYVQRLVREGRL